MARFRFALPISLIVLFTLHFVAAAPGREPESAIAFVTINDTFAAARSVPDDPDGEDAPTAAADPEQVSGPDDVLHPFISVHAPAAVRGLYLSGWGAGVRLAETVEYMVQHNLNTIVLDIKDTDGRLSFALPGTLADALGANAFKMGSAERVQQALQHFRQEGIYVIGRLVLFQDNFLPYLRPEWALQLPEGGLWFDPSGNAWLDPTHSEVLDYHVEIAVAAAQLGFDEIQFDYVRYPEYEVAGYNDGTKQQRVQTITDVAAASRRRIQAQVDVLVSAAIYGIVAVNERDHNLGQDFIALAEALDYISPMFYPSHYLAGDFGLSDPNSEPYTTLFASTAAALARADAAQWSRLRPWIQSFFGYDREQVEDQIRALKDLGVDSFLVWNPSGRYVPDVDYRLAAEGDGHFANSPFRTALYPLMSPAAGVFVPDPALKLPTSFTNGQYGAETGWHVHAQRQRGGYRVELWREVRDAPDERIVTVQRTQNPRTRTEAPVVVDEDGFTLVWTDADYEWQLWAPSRGEALEAQRSLRTVPSSLF